MIPHDMYEAALNYLQRYAYQTNLTGVDANDRAAAILLLTRNGIVTTNAIDHLQNYLQKYDKSTWHQTNAALYLAAAYQLLQQTDYANNLVKQFIQKRKYYDAKAVRVLSHYFPQKAKQAITKDDIVQIIQGLTQRYFLNSGKIYAVLALQRYAKLLPASPQQQITATEIMPKEQQKILLSGHEIKNKAFNAHAKQLILTQQQGHGFYYQMIVAGYPKLLPKKPISHGMEIYGELDNVAGKKIDKVKLGEIVTMHIRIRALGSYPISNVSIVNLLPSGFMLMPYSLSSYQYNSVDIRSDRIIFHINITPTVKNITYQLRAINPGLFTLPPLLAENTMASEHYFAQSVAEKINIL